MTRRVAAHPLVARVAAEHLTARELEVMGRLVEGQTDAQIARALGVNPRTVTRTVARLLVKLESTSRFAAGAEACRRGWL